MLWFLYGTDLCIEAHISNDIIDYTYTKGYKKAIKLHDISRVDKQRNEPGRWKSRIVAIFLLFLTLLHVLT